MKKKRIAALAAAASLALAGCGSQAATNGNEQRHTADTPERPGPGRRDGLQRARDELGVSVEKLQAAMQKNRPQAGRAAQRFGH